MTLTHVTTAPKEEDFIPLEEHQTTTPDTFFGGKPVLYAHYKNLTLSIPSSSLSSSEAVSKFDAATEGDETLIKNVDVWVNSAELVLFQPSPSPNGVAVPFPTIALHATMKYKSQTEALYMNLSLNDADAVNDEDDIQLLEVTVLPPDTDSADAQRACILDIFAAMNSCADLHPDPNSSDVEDEEDDGPAPGAGGWITVDNMDQYLDEDGNFRPGMGIGEELGPGAGTVRQRDGADAQGADDANGVNGDEYETKYQRTG